MGSLLGGQSAPSVTTQNVNQTSDPWGPQQGSLTQGLSSAWDVYNNRNNAGWYGGNYVAGGTPDQAAANNTAMGYNQGAGTILPQQTATTASTLQGAANPYVSNASSLYANGAGSSSPLASILSGYASGATPAVGGSPLTSALNQAAMTGAGSLSNYLGGATNVMNSAAADPTQGLIDSANQYMNSSGVQGAVNSTNDLIDQTLNEQTVPGLNRQASMGGALNSSRAGMAESMANEGAALAKGNADSSLLNNAWNQGLNTAATERNNGLSTSLQAALGGLSGAAGLAGGQQASNIGTSEFGTNTALNAANSGLNYDLGNRGLNAQTQLGANAQLGNAAGLGINGATSAGQQALTNYALGSGAGSSEQSLNQADLNNSLAQWTEANTYPQSILNDYWNIVGKPLGTSSSSTSTGTAAQGQNGVSNALGLGLGAASLFGGSGSATAGLGGLTSGLFSSGGALSSLGDLALMGVPFI